MLKGMERLTRREWLKRSLFTALSAGAVLGSSSVAQAYGLSTARVSRPLAGLREPLRIAFLTDLHYGLYMKEGSVQRWVNVTQAERPDLILLGGDFIDLKAGVTPEPLLEQLSQLSAPLGVYGVWGNHDYGSFGSYHSRWRGEKSSNWQANREAMTRHMQSAGVTILRNEAAQPRPDLHLMGTDDLWWGDKPDIQALMAGAEGKASLLLTHNPDILPSLPLHVGLTLAGHTHGGQIRLPIVGALTLPSIYGSRFDMGWKSGAFDSPAYISRGLGCSALPLRMLCPPEITMLTLTPA